MNVSEPCGRVNAQLGDERSPGVLEHRERVSLPTGRAERLHQLAPKPLAQRVLGRQLLDLRDKLGTAAECEVGVDQIFRGG